jgi:hypothetical protein
MLNSGWLSVHQCRISTYQVSITLHVSYQWQGFFLVHIHIVSLGTLTAVTHVKSLTCSNTSCSVSHTVSRGNQEVRRVSRRASERNLRHRKDAVRLDLLENGLLQGKVKETSIKVQSVMLQRTILQRRNATTNSFYQYYQDATTKTDATTNDFLWFLLGKVCLYFHRGRLFVLFVCVGLFMLFIRESLFIVFTKERMFMLFKFTCKMYKS